MGGKGRKRREKNYRAAHGGQVGLPPPPNRTALDAVPSKLRKIMSFTRLETGKHASDGADKNRGDKGSRLTDKRIHAGNRKDDGNSTAKFPNVDEEDVQSSVHEKKKKKRKRNLVSDLRFEQSDGLGGIGSKRKERRKQRLEDMKKKRKKIKEGENESFKARDEVKFGEVVEAPPKLVVVPKAFKTTQDASQERLRIQAVEGYRALKGWTSRLGVRLPLTATMPQDTQLS